MNQDELFEGAGDFDYHINVKSEADRNLAKSILRPPISVDFSNKSLGEVLNSIAGVSGVNLVIDWRALETIGVEPEAPISLSLKKVSLGKVLALVLEQVTDPDIPAGLLIDDGVLMLTSDQVIRDRHAVIRTYNIGELQERTNELIDIIASQIDPGGWDIHGGDAGSLSPFGELLIVRATPSIHRKVARLLDEMRANGSHASNKRTAGTAVRAHARKFAETFRRQAHDFRDGDAAATLKADRTAWLVSLLDHLAGDGALPEPIARRLPVRGDPVSNALDDRARWQTLVAGLVADHPMQFDPKDAQLGWRTFKPGPARWWRDGAPMPDGWNLIRDGGGFRQGDAMKRESIETTGDGMNEADWKKYARRWCERNAMACNLIADLLEPAADADESPPATAKADAAGGASVAPVTVVLWEGAQHSERNIRLARVRTAYLEQQGKVKLALQSLESDGHTISKTTFYVYLKELDEEIPGWRKGILLSGRTGKMENGVTARKPGKSKGKRG